jgi:hypothetical protein
MRAAKDCAIKNLAKARFEPSIKAGIDTTYNKMYRAAMFMVEDATTNPTSPVHKEVIVWKGLSPVASECLWSGVSLLSPREQGEDLLVTANTTRVATPKVGRRAGGS